MLPIPEASPRAQWLEILPSVQSLPRVKQRVHNPGVATARSVAVASPRVWPGRRHGPTENDSGATDDQVFGAYFTLWM
jgi:hypothetical protein